MSLKNLYILITSLTENVKFSYFLMDCIFVNNTHKWFIIKSITLLNSSVQHAHSLEYILTHSTTFVWFNASLLLACLLM